MEFSPSRVSSLSHQIAKAGRRGTPLRGKNSEKCRLPISQSVAREDSSSYHRCCQPSATVEVVDDTERPTLFTTLNGTVDRYDGAMS